MSRAAASIFSELHLRTGSLRGEVADAKRILGGLQSQASKLAGPAQRFLIATGAAVALAAREYANAERQAAALRSALAANGYEVEQNAASFDRFADAIAAVTTLDDDAVKGLGVLALNLGATAENMQDVVQAGIGLGQRFFGGDFEQGVKAATLATQGQVTQLQRLVPALKRAKGESEVLAIVNRAATAGFKQAKADAQSFAGSMIVLRNEVGNAAESLGEAFAPEIQAAAAHVREIAKAIRELTPEQRHMIVNFTKTSAVAAGSVVAFNKVDRGVTGLLAVFRGLGVGGAALAGVTALLVGIGALFVNLTGKGNTFAERFEDAWERSSAAMEKFKAKTIGSWDDLWNAVVFRFFQANTTMFGGDAEQMFRDYLDAQEADRKAAEDQAKRDAQRRTQNEKQALDDQAKLHGNAVRDWKDAERSKVTDALGVHRDIQAAILNSGIAKAMHGGEGGAPSRPTPEQRAAEEERRRRVVAENAAIQREQALERKRQQLLQERRRLVTIGAGGEYSSDADEAYRVEAKLRKNAAELAKAKAARLQAQNDRRAAAGEQAGPGATTPLSRDVLGDQIKNERQLLEQARKQQQQALNLGNESEALAFKGFIDKHAQHLRELEEQFKLGKGRDLQETPEDRMNKDFGANVDRLVEELKKMPPAVGDAIAKVLGGRKVGVLDE